MNNLIFMAFHLILFDCFTWNIYCWFSAIARLFCRFLFHVKQYQIGGIRRDCFAHRLGTGVAREIDVYI